MNLSWQKCLLRSGLNKASWHTKALILSMTHEWFSNYLGLYFLSSLKSIWYSKELYISAITRLTCFKKSFFMSTTWAFLPPRNKIIKYKEIKFFYYSFITFLSKPHLPLLHYILSKLHLQFIAPATWNKNHKYKYTHNLSRHVQFEKWNEYTYFASILCRYKKKKKKTLINQTNNSWKHKSITNK